MSSKNTTNTTGDKVATNEILNDGTGESVDNASIRSEVPPGEQENSTVSDSAPTGTGNVNAAAKSRARKTADAKAKTNPKKVKAAAAKAKPKKVEAAKSQPKNVAQKKTVSNDKIAAGSKKIKLAASTYHYYRNWLAEFMRSHGVSSAKFQKAPESYNGHIVVLDTEKAKGLKALEQWSKQNPDTKELFWDVKK